jgi:hypothetical protein
MIRPTKSTATAGSRSVLIWRAMLTALSMNRASPSLATVLASVTTAARPFAAGRCEMLDERNRERRRKPAIRDECADRVRADAHRGQFLLVNVRISSGDLSHTKLLTVDWRLDCGVVEARHSPMANAYFFAGSTAIATASV